jgi:hypothetical protein
VPLRRDDVLKLGKLASGTLLDHPYAPFLALVVGARRTYYLLWLPRRT